MRDTKSALWLERLLPRFLLSHPHLAPSKSSQAFLCPSGLEGSTGPEIILAKHHFFRDRIAGIHHHIQHQFGYKMIVLVEVVKYNELEV